MDELTHLSEGMGPRIQILPSRIMCRLRDQPGLMPGMIVFAQAKSVALIA